MVCLSGLCLCASLEHKVVNRGTLTGLRSDVFAAPTVVCGVWGALGKYLWCGCQIWY